ncbi:IPT/TIG domain-containing protein [Crocosphaera sp.]|uniref:IPT/TIG domain-containing protein n=1 Tax=Crocosphaera sp. TaxID=2729996 RepID=UPI00257D7043|nr:IPT/TIG domain-containing protein [Crocosphaera sp.]NQZ62559.1 hypothetical protein [Crocosphaera sp.]
MNKPIRLIAFLLCASVFIPSCSMYYGLQKAKVQDVYIDMGTPRHWTLDDAHYLIAGIHSRARGIGVTKPTNLQPNAFNSSKITQVEIITKLALSYDELAGAKNKLELNKLENQKSDQVNARADLIEIETKIALLRASILETTKNESEQESHIAQHTLQIEYHSNEANRFTNLLNNLPAIGDGEEETEEQKIKRKKIEIEIDGHNEIVREKSLSKSLLQQDKLKTSSTKAVQKEELTHLETSRASSKDVLKDLTIELKKVDVPENNGITKEGSIARDAFSKAISNTLNDPKNGLGITPKLHTSDILSNYISAENELLARQLTLIRNEIGQNNNLIFLELPHSVDSAQGLSNRRKVQVEWNITSYCIGDPIKDKMKEISKLKETESTNEESPATKSTNDKSLMFWPEKEYTNQNEIEEIEKEIKVLSRNKEKFVKGACDGDNTRKVAMETDSLMIPKAWDMIPKSDAFNIAEFDLADKEYNLTAIFSSITGIGAGASYSKRKQLFEQFATQQVFASAYGQGKSRFGWILNPKPGSDVVSPGAKTTYASILAPNSATVIKFSARYCILKDDEVITRLTDNNSAKNKCYEDPEIKPIVINKSKIFWVDSIDYGIVQSGDIATILIKGDDFSGMQLKVLVEGHPLIKYTGVGAIASREIPLNKYGTYEVLNSKEVVINLQMPNDYVGTPEITLITPSKSRTINYLKTRLGILKGKKSKLIWNKSIPMFQKAPEISSIDERPSVPVPGQIELVINGDGFYENSVFIVNNTLIYDVDLRSSKKALITVAADKSWDVTVINKLASKNLSFHKTKAKPAKPSTDMSISNINIVRSIDLSNGKIKMDVIVEGSNFIEDDFEAIDLAKPVTIKSVKFTSSNMVYLVIESNKFKNPIAFTQGKKTHFHLLISPKKPVITTIVNSVTQGAFGSNVGGYNIVIEGENFTNVTELMFGKKITQIIAKTEKVITVIAPGGTGKVPIILKTDSMINGVQVTNAADLTGPNGYFTYKRN